ncbi:MAG: hypothetical protein PHP44_11135 [Kiritimatiellae bacterium]|nr:hypothetical protein [Kiritimatiellia bacterium]
MIYDNATADLACVGSEKKHTPRWGHLSAPLADKRAEESFTSVGVCLPTSGGARDE